MTTIWTLWICSGVQCSSFVETPDGETPTYHCPDAPPLVVCSMTDQVSDPWPAVLIDRHRIHHFPASITLQRTLDPLGLDPDLYAVVGSTAMSLIARPGLFAFPNLENERVFATVLNTALDEQARRRAAR